MSLESIIEPHNYYGVSQTDDVYRVHCRCDWKSEPSKDYMPGINTDAVRARHAAHVAAAIRADRTITTVEQLDALPVGSWIRDDCDVTFVRRSSSDIGWFDAQSGLDPLCDLFGARYIAFPARVLYRPDEDGAQ